MMALTPSEMTALAAIKAQPHGLAIFIPSAVDDEMRSALENLAAETGRQVLAEPPPTPSEEAAAAARWLQHEAPGTGRNDHEDLIENLGDTAGGVRINDVKKQ